MLSYGDAGRSSLLDGSSGILMVVPLEVCAIYLQRVVVLRRFGSKVSSHSGPECDSQRRRRGGADFR